MSDNNIPLWERDAQHPEVTSLRKPNANSEAEAPQSVAAEPEAPSLRRPNAQPVDDPKEPDVSRSSLSADAKEWYPPNFDTSTLYSPSNNTSVQSRLNRHKCAQNAEPQLLGRDAQIENDIRRFKSLINTLTNDPGQFDDLVLLFMETLSSYFNNIEVVLEISRILFDQAVRQPNFRYTAARLCCIFEEHSPLFRSQMHMTCEKEMNNNAQRQQDLLLFVAELYTQLQYGNVYANSLLQIMQNLLTKGSVDDVKHVCQALKLTGRSLERYSKPVLDEIFAQLEACRGILNPSVTNLLNSIIALRNSDWGVSQSAALNNSTPQEDTYGNLYDDGNLIYCPDGQELSLEEQNFLANNLDQGHDFLGDDSDPDELCDPEPEMDEEIQAAFKDFVKLSKR